MTWNAELIFFSSVSAADLETPHSVLPFNYSASLTEKTNILILSEMHEDGRNPLPASVEEHKSEESSGMYLSHLPISSFGDCFYSSC